MTITLKNSEITKAMEDRDRVIMHLIKRLETELKETTCDRCLDIVQEIKRILSI